MNASAAFNLQGGRQKFVSTCYDIHAVALNARHASDIICLHVRMQVHVQDLLAPSATSASPVRFNISSSRQVCNSWVHLLDGVLWPSAMVPAATLPSIPATARQQGIPLNW